MRLRVRMGPSYLAFFVLHYRYCDHRLPFEGHESFETKHTRRISHGGFCAKRIGFEGAGGRGGRKIASPPSSFPSLPLSHFHSPSLSVTQAATKWSIRCCSRGRSTSICKREWETVEKVAANDRENEALGLFPLFMQLPEICLWNFKPCGLAVGTMTEGYGGVTWPKTVLLM